MIFNKKTSQQIMYIRDFRTSILAWKDYKINTKASKNCKIGGASIKGIFLKTNALIFKN